MAVSIIQAEYELLSQIVNQFDIMSDCKAQMTRKVRYVVDTLEQDGWWGRGAQAFYREMYEDVLPGLSRLQQAFAEAGAVTKQILEVLQRSEEEAARLFGNEIPEQQSKDLVTIFDDGSILYGDPDAAAEFISNQGNAPDCTIHAAYNALRMAGVENITLADVMRTALELQRNGKATRYHDGTWDPEVVAKLMETYGANVEMLGTEGKNFFSDGEQVVTDYATGESQPLNESPHYFLTRHVMKGNPIVVDIDIQDLPNSSTLARIDDWLGGDSGHTVLVTGVKVDANNNIVEVIINDSRTPEQGGGAGIAIPYEDFMNAWQDREYHAYVIKG